MKKLLMKQKFKPMGAGASFLNGLSMEGTLVDIKGEHSRGGKMAVMISKPPKIFVTV